MGYLQALNLLIRTYKATKGYLPKGLDMLKLKMKARQKVIDSTKGKILQFPKERITDWTKARPQPPKIEMKGGIQTTRGLGDLFKRQMAKKGKELDELIRKGTIKVGQAPKTTKRKPAVDPKLTQEENIKRIMAENKASAKRLQEKMNKPEKSLGEKLKDYKGDPDAMRDGGKVKKKRKHNDNVDDEDIGEGESKERFLNKMPKPRNYPNLSEEEIILDKMPRPKRSDGIISLATGGMTNISDTYDNNPTLQSQYPNKQDYLDMFAQQTTTTTPQTDTITQSTTSTIAPINPIKPIIPLPQDSGGDGGNLPPGGGITAGINFDYGYTSPGGNLDADGNFNNIDDIGEGTVADEDYTLGMRARDAYSGIKQAITYNPLNPMFQFNVAKAALSKGKEKALDIIQKAKDAAAARELAKLQEAARAAGFQGDTRTDAETSFASSQTYGGGGSGRDQGADTFDI